MIVVTASLLSRPGCETRLEAEVMRLLAATRREAGCLQYDLHVDTGDARRLVLIERWSDPAALEAHRRTPHISAFRDRSRSLLAEDPEVRVLAPLEPRPDGGP